MHAALQGKITIRCCGMLSCAGLLNLVMAHLTLEGVNAGRPFDLGALLLYFLQRFGCDFDYERHAISIRQVICLALYFPHSQGFATAKCPCPTGHCSSGLQPCSFRIVPMSSKPAAW